MNELQQKILAQALPLSGQEVSATLAALGKQLDQLRLTAQAQLGAVAENTQAITANTQAQASRSATTNAVRAVEGASKFLGGGLAFMPLVSSLASLFRGSKPEPPPLVPYVAPRATRLEGGVTSTNTGVVPVDYGQDGLPRGIALPGRAGAANVTVQVQAIDSRSFMDHSADIARAVREAMLNAHALNDVINEI